MKTPEQGEALPFALNLVDFDKPQGEVPEEERVNRDKTLETRKHLLDDLGRLPRAARGIQQTLGVGLAQPTPAEIKQYSQARTDQLFAVCGECARFSYAAGQEVLNNGGAWAIKEKLGEAAAYLGDWRKFGWCEVLSGPCDFRAPKCDNYQAKKKGLFGRILGGTWKRLRDI